jgi:hypothetical protein
MEVAPMDQRTSTIAIISIALAIGSFFGTFQHHSIVGFMAALFAIPLGIIGLLMAASPRGSGGILSIMGIVVGSLGLVLSLVVGMGRLVL